MNTRGLKINTIIIFGIIIVFWILLLYLSQTIGVQYVIARSGYIAQNPWANFDGLHYYSIAKHGLYFQYEQAFFPLLPILINKYSILFNLDFLSSSIIVARIPFVFGLFFFWKLLRIDYKYKASLWTMIIFLFFPTSFFFASVYTESLFILLLFSSLYFIRKEKFLLGSLIAGFASATRLVGIFILPSALYEAYLVFKQNNSRWNKKILLNFLFPLSIIPLGLLFYVFYLLRTYNDAFAFIHSQAAFGANRSSGELILLPQVLFRYFKILTTIPTSNYDFWIASFELFVFLSCSLLLVINYKKIRLSYLLFSFFAIIIPTLTGTLSSVPRYVLVAFPVFIAIAQIKNNLFKILLATISIIFLIIFTSLFLKGYFIA